MNKTEQRLLQLDDLAGRLALGQIRQQDREELIGLVVKEGRRLKGLAHRKPKEG